MTIRCICLLKLPFSFAFQRRSEVRSIDISGVNIMPVRNKSTNYFDTIKIEYHVNIEEEELQRIKENFDKRYEFKRKVMQKMGIEANKFIASYYRLVDNCVIGQVFNGSDFITAYELMLIDENKNSIDGTEIGNSAVNVITPSVFERILHDITVEDRNIAIELKRMANCFLENGYFDMAVMNIAMS